MAKDAGFAGWIAAMQEYMNAADHNAAQNPKSDEILIVVVEPGKKPYKKIIADNLDAMREIVGGYIELVNIKRNASGAMLAITCNEEGKLIGLPFNRRILTSTWQDAMAGTFFITAYNMHGENVSLSETDAQYFIKKFSTTEVYL